MNPFEVERLGWEEIRGLPIVPDSAIGTGRFRIVCSRDVDGAELEEVEAVGEPRRGSRAGGPGAALPPRRERPRRRSRSRARGRSIHCWTSMLRRKNSPVQIRTPIAIRITPPVAMISAVVALDDRERRRHPRERERGEQERDRQAGRVDGEQEGAAAGGVRERRGGEDRAQGRPDARRPGDREGGPATTGPPLPARSAARRRATRGSARGRTERRRRSAPIAMIRAAGDLVERARWCSLSVDPIPVAVRPSRMKIAEKLATKRRLGAEHPPPAGASRSAGETPVTADR